MFHLYFPGVESASGVTAAKSLDMAHGRGEHVLYVDDDHALVSLAIRTLQRLGYKVTGYTNPAQALREFQSRPGDFDVVVTDLSMPGMSGFDLARELFAARPDVPVIMTSGYLQPEDQEAARKQGILELILKPNTVEELGQALERLFRHHVRLDDAGPGD
jgi:CheY-like chemotaxis protein